MAKKKAAKKSVLKKAGKKSSPKKSPAKKALARKSVAKKVAQTAMAPKELLSAAAKISAPTGSCRYFDVNNAPQCASPVTQAWCTAKGGLWVQDGSC